MSGSLVIGGVSCGSYEIELLNCSNGYINHRCHSGGNVGVRCREEMLRVKNVSASTVYSNYTKQSVMISWELYSNPSHRQNLSSFRVECFNNQHRMELFVNNGTLLQLNIRDLFSSTSFACCVLAIYYENYETERRCYTISSELLLDLVTSPTPNQTINELFMTPTSTQMNPSMIPTLEKVVGSDSVNMRASIIGGVLGSIIIILLLLLAICGGVLLFLLRSRNVIPKM